MQIHPFRDDLHAVQFRVRRVFEKLNERERRIVELVARGRTNQEVADRLRLSHKTVEWTLTRVYKKLHVRSRTELAAKLAKATAPRAIPGISRG